MGARIRLQLSESFEPQGEAVPQAVIDADDQLFRPLGIGKAVSPSSTFNSWTSSV
jgi:hypothetical protein